MKNLTQLDFAHNPQPYASPVNTTPNMNKNIKIESVTIIKSADSYADLSFLDQFENAPKGSEERKYYKADQKRKAAYGNDWEMVGIYVKVKYGFPSGLSAELRSGGLWGIESDSEDGHFLETAREEAHELRNDVAALGLDVEQFDQLFAKAIEEEFTYA